MSSSTNQFLLVVIAIIIPPLAVFLEYGLSSKFWISLVLTLLFFVPGMLYSLYVILNK